jgi:hypothetical protein
MVDHTLEQFNVLVHKLVVAKFIASGCPCEIKCCEIYVPFVSKHAVYQSVRTENIQPSYN